MVALEALACGTPVLASNSLHSLPSIVFRPDEETPGSWADLVNDLLGTKVESGDELNQHYIESINLNLLDLYQELIE